MENLTEKVYECSLAVEAHMVCDLLSQAGISARVDGEFMQSAMGEIPVGNAVKVRVDPARAAEAREVIADWDKQQPVDPIAVPVTKTSSFKSPLWFLIGGMVGVAGASIALRTPTTYDSVDYDGDGRNEITYQYAGSAIARTEFDRNDDGRIDARWIFDINGVEREYDVDDDFDGSFEWRGDAEEGEVTRNVLDADGDGRPERVEHSKEGVLARVDFYAPGGSHVAKRQHFRAGLLESAEFDDDGDGVFERRVGYDQFEEPRL